MPSLFGNKDAHMSWRRWAISIKWRMLKNKALLYSA